MTIFSRTLGCAILLFPMLFAGPARPQGPPESARLAEDRGRFDVRSGASFSASRTDLEKRSSDQIAADLQEAAEIVMRHHASPIPKTVGLLIEDAIRGMLTALDPHSKYHPPDDFDNLLLDQNSQYSGVGITISTFERDGDTNTYIVATRPGSPAAGKLRFGDRLTKINGTDVSGKPLAFVGGLLRGPEHSRVEITVERFGGEIEIVPLIRITMPSPSITDFYMLPARVGYINLGGGFSHTTATELKNAVSSLKAGRASSLILDLRGNSGGIFDQAVSTAETFLARGSVIVSQKGRHSADYRTWTSENRSPITVPLLVLVDDQTASAAEIVVAALKENGRAVIVGETTFGKALVQSVLDLPHEAGLTLTTARYFTPLGRSIQRRYESIYGYRKKRSVRSGGPGAFAHEDGIKPDVHAAPNEMTPLEPRLADDAFFFLRETFYGSDPKLAARGDELVTRFLTRLAADGKYTNNDLASAQMKYLAEKHLQYYSTAASTGVIAAERILLRDDKQLLAALEALPRAAAMAKPKMTQAFTDKKRLAESRPQRVKGRNRRN